MMETRPLLRPEEMDKLGKEGLFAFLGMLGVGWIISNLLYSYLPKKVWIFEIASQDSLFLMFAAVGLFLLGRAFAFVETGRVLRERAEMKELGESWEDEEESILMKEVE